MLGTGARSDDPAESARRPGARRRDPRDRREPGAEVGDDPRHPARHRRARRRQAELVHREQPGRATSCAPRPTRCPPSSACRSPTSIRANFPHFSADGRRDRWHRRQHPVHRRWTTTSPARNFAAGPNHLNGEQALQFSRDRYSLPRRRHRPHAQPGPADHVGAPDDPGRADRARATPCVSSPPSAAT